MPSDNQTKSSNRDTRRRKSRKEEDLWAREGLERARKGRERWRLMKSGKLEKTLRFFALNGPSNIYKFSKMNKLVYSTAHGLIKRLERLGFVEVISVVKNEKRAIAKLYGLSKEGFKEATRYCEGKELDRLFRIWAEIYKSKLLKKWGYIVEKLGESSGTQFVRASIAHEHPFDKFVYEVFLCIHLYETYDKFIESEWIPFLMDDKQFRKTTLGMIDGRIQTITDDIAKIRDDVKFFERLRVLFQDASV